MVATATALAVTCGVAGTATLAIGGIGVLRERRRSPLETYLTELDGYDDMAPEDVPDEFTQRLARPFVDRIVTPALLRLVALAGALTPRDHRIRVRSQLTRAGLDLTRRAEEVIALQAAGFLLGLLVGVAALASGAFSPVVGVLLLVVLVGVGTWAPMVWLSRRIEERTSALANDMPETLDLLAISVGAGLGLEGAMQVVVERSDGPLAEEIGRTLHEMGLGLSRRDALANLRERSHVPELSAFVQALIQADALGMPLNRVLKLQAAEMRSKRRAWARERAAKLPVKILFPLVACIFPAVLVVVLGPAVSQIGAAL